MRLVARDRAHHPAAEEVLSRYLRGRQILGTGEGFSASRAASEPGVEMNAAAALAPPGGSGRIGSAEEQLTDVDRSIASVLSERGAELVEEIFALLLRMLEDLLHQAAELVVAPSEHVERVPPGIASHVLELVGRYPVCVCENAQHRIVARFLGRVFLGAIEARPSKPGLLERKVCLAEQEVCRVQRLIVLDLFARLPDQLELLLGNIVLPRYLIVSIPFEKLVPGVALVYAVELRVCALDWGGAKLHEFRQDRTRQVADLVALELEEFFQRDARRMAGCLLALPEGLEAWLEMVGILVFGHQRKDLVLETLVLGLVFGTVGVVARNAGRRRDEDFAAQVALVLNLDLQSQVCRILAAVGECDELAVAVLRLQRGDQFGSEKLGGLAETSSEASDGRQATFPSLEFAWRKRPE